MGEGKSCILGSQSAKYLSSHLGEIKWNLYPHTCHPQLPVLAGNARSNFARVIKEGFQRQCYSWLFCSFLLLKKLCVLQSGIDKLLPRSRHAYLLAMPFFPLSKHQMQAAWANCHPPNPEMLCVSGSLTCGCPPWDMLPPGSQLHSCSQIWITSSVQSLSSLLTPVSHMFSHVSMNKLSPKARSHCCPQKYPVAFLGRWRESWARGCFVPSREGVWRWGPNFSSAEGNPRSSEY